MGWKTKIYSMPGVEGKHTKVFGREKEISALFVSQIPAEEDTPKWQV
jgi:hypothetical protein